MVFGVGLCGLSRRCGLVRRLLCGLQIRASLRQEVAEVCQPVLSLGHHSPLGAVLGLRLLGGAGRVVDGGLSLVEGSGAGLELVLGLTCRLQRRTHGTTRLVQLMQLRVQLRVGVSGLLL